MPLGSSSAAPVMRPGPSRLAKPWLSLAAPAFFFGAGLAAAAGLVFFIAGFVVGGGSGRAVDSRRRSAGADRVQECVHRLDHYRAFADAGGDPLDRARAHVADGVDA